MAEQNTKNSVTKLFSKIKKNTTFYEVEVNTENLPTMSLPWQYNTRKDSVTKLFKKKIKNTTFYEMEVNRENLPTMFMPWQNIKQKKCYKISLKK